MVKEEWEQASAGGRRWAYFGSMIHGATLDSPTVRIVRWYSSGVRVRFSDGHQETVHPDYLFLRAA